MVLAFDQYRLDIVHGESLMKRIAVVASIVAVLLSPVAVVQANELKVLSAGTMHFALKGYRS